MVVDPASNGMNLFAYCGNNAVCRADFSGYCWYDSNGMLRHDNWEYIANYDGSRVIDYSVSSSKKGEKQ